MENENLNEPQKPALNKTHVSGSYYLVRYCGGFDYTNCGGSYDDYYTAVVFVTNNKSTATKYCSRFNKALKKWKAYYEQFETDKFGMEWGMKWIADEHVEKHFDRWNSLQNITKCYYEEVSFR